MNLKKLALVAVMLVGILLLPIAADISTNLAYAGYYWYSHSYSWFRTWNWAHSHNYQNDYNYANQYAYAGNNRCWPASGGYGYSGPPMFQTASYGRPIRGGFVGPWGSPSYSTGYAGPGYRSHYSGPRSHYVGPNQGLILDYPGPRSQGYGGNPRYVSHYGNPGNPGHRPVQWVARYNKDLPAEKATWLASYDGQPITEKAVWVAKYDENPSMMTAKKGQWVAKYDKNPSFLAANDWEATYYRRKLDLNPQWVAEYTDPFGAKPANKIAKKP